MIQGLPIWVKMEEKCEGDICMCHRLQLSQVICSVMESPGVIFIKEMLMSLRFDTNRHH